MSLNMQVKHCYYRLVNASTNSLEFSRVQATISVHSPTNIFFSLFYLFHLTGPRREICIQMSLRTSNFTSTARNSGIGVTTT